MTKSEWTAFWEKTVALFEQINQIETNGIFEMFDVSDHIIGFRHFCFTISFIGYTETTANRKKTPMMPNLRNRVEQLRKLMEERRVTFDVSECTMTTSHEGKKQKIRGNFQLAGKMR